MLYRNQLHIRHLALAMVALAVSMTAMAQTELEDLVNTRWEVGLSKVGWDTEDCTDDTCLKADDVFEIQTHDVNDEGVGSGWFVIERDGKVIAQFRSIVRVEQSSGNPDDVENVSFSFVDHMATDDPWKHFQITPVPVEDNAQAACIDRLRNLTRGGFTDDDLDLACPTQKTPMVHWLVCTPYPASNCQPGSHAGVPDDGQGTGTGGN